MEIRPVDSVVRIVDHAAHDEREQPQKRHHSQKKEKIRSGPVYKPNGKLDEDPPSKIDVLV